MLMVTTDAVPGRGIAPCPGLVRGSTVRARHIRSNVVASFCNPLGSEVGEYASLPAGARGQAIDRMIEQAETPGADAVVGMRMQTSAILQGASEMPACGTAVRLG